MTADNQPMTPEEPQPAPLRALVLKWRHAAEHLGLEGLASLDDCADELEVAIRAAHGQAPAAPSECKTEAERTAFAFGWFKALEQQREQEPAQAAPELTETAVTAKNPAAPVSSFEDSRTQAVYEVLVNDNYPPACGNEHWEGWKARLIVDALFPIEAPAHSGEPVAWLEYARKKPSSRRLVFTRSSRKDLRSAGWVAEPLYAAPQPSPAAQEGET